ncbi:hypothetical protein EV363DRAFT_1452000 [Boletus edulis]|nr:hypothetical protein EV363DRAFT_1452000 [Boletus edulis]
MSPLPLPPRSHVNDNDNVVSLEMTPPKLRIAFVHPDLGIDGAERLVVDAALGLQALGHTVDIYTSHHDPNHCFDETRDDDNDNDMPPPPPPCVHRDDDDEDDDDEDDDDDDEDEDDDDDDDDDDDGMSPPPPPLRSHVNDDDVPPPPPPPPPRVH